MGKPALVWSAESIAAQTGYKPAINYALAGNIELGVEKYVGTWGVENALVWGAPTYTVPLTSYGTTLSQEVAALQRMGTLSHYPLPNDYFPGKFYSALDPGLNSLTREIYQTYPGLVQGVRKPIYGSVERGLITDADIFLRGDIVIQFKSGSAAGLRRQVVVTEVESGYPTIGFAPDLRSGQIKNLKKNPINIPELGVKGIIPTVTNDRKLLMEVIRPN